MLMHVLMQSTAQGHRQIRYHRRATNVRGGLSAAQQGVPEVSANRSGPRR
jgi:hypothetical protein